MAAIRPASGRTTLLASEKPTQRTTRGVQAPKENVTTRTAGCAVLFNEGVGTWSCRGSRCRGRLPHLTPLRGDKDMRLYADGYERGSGYRVPDTYLRRSAVLGLVVRGSLVGGGVLQTEMPLRTLQRLPGPERERVADRLAGRRVVEVTCVWLRADERGGIVAALFWCALLRRIHGTGAELIVFGTEQAGLHRFYLTTHADLVYQGPVTVDGQKRLGWIFVKRNASPWPVVVRMTLHRARRWVRRPTTGRVARRPVREG